MTESRRYRVERAPTQPIYPGEQHEEDAPDLKLQHRKDKAMHESMSEVEIDKMLKDTFPASDPPSH